MSQGTSHISEQPGFRGTLQDIVNAMPAQTAIVIGDIMLDRFVYGDVHRISPESPVPVLTIESETVMLGGAGNVLSNLAGLGMKTHILALAGDDAAGASVRELVRERGADPAGLLAVAGRPTTVKTRFLAAHQQLLRTDAERTEDISAAAEKQLLDRFASVLPGAGAVILSDYGKGLLTPGLIAAVIAQAKAAGVPVLVDPKKADYAIYTGADVVTPNRKELALAVGGLPTKTDEDIVQASQILLRQAGIGAVLATRSQDGMSIIRRTGKGDGFEEPVHLRTEALEVFDVSGAGDTVIATTAAALAAGADLTAAAALANIAGGIVVAKVGTAPVRRAELLEALSRKEGGALRTPGKAGEPGADNFHDWDAAAETVQRWKARGLKVGFTNGCFDILHQGHVSYLQQARARCDRLVLGVNADESVRRLKGASRPVNDETARAIVLAALSAVDMVVIFGTKPGEDDKPVKLIERLRPDIFFKGGDYTIDRLPEAPVVQSYGGEVAIMPHYEGHSTTATIEKMAAGEKMKTRAG